MAARLFSGVQRSGCLLLVLARSRAWTHRRSVPVELVGKIPDDAPPGLVDLSATDLASLRAISRLQSNENVSFVLRGQPLREQVPSLGILVSDLRMPGGERSVAALRRRGVLSVLVVAVGSSESLQKTARLARQCDSVLRVVVPADVDAEAPLFDALTAVTAFATADCVWTELDQAYAFFDGGTRLTVGRASGGDDVKALLNEAVERAWPADRPLRSRMMLHVVTSMDDLAPDLASLVEPMRRAMEVEDLWFSVAVTKSGEKAVSFVASEREP